MGKTIVALNAQVLEKSLNDAVRDVMQSTEFRATFYSIMCEMMRDYHIENYMPEWIGGDKRAGELIGKDAMAMKNMRRSGGLREGVDWKKANDKAERGKILWSKNALLKMVKG